MPTDFSAVVMSVEAALPRFGPADRSSMAPRGTRDAGRKRKLIDAKVDLGQRRLVIARQEIYVHGRYTFRFVLPIRVYIDRQRVTYVNAFVYTHMSVYVLSIVTSMSIYREKSCVARWVAIGIPYHTLTFTHTCLNS